MPKIAPQQKADSTLTSTFIESRLFLIFLCLYFLIWSIAPALLASSVPLDVNEGLNWGSEWQWGYYKHPPFSSWVLYTFYKVFGHFGPYLLSQLYVLLTLGIVYRLGVKIWSPATAFIGSVLTLAIVYYTYPSLEFNHNVAQFPIWAGLYLTFYQAITRNKFYDWVILGILGGIGMLTKYTVIFLLFPMALFLLHPRQWHLLKQLRPWVAAIIMLIIFAPHLYWLIQNDWLPLRYASGRYNNMNNDAGIVTRHMSWLGFTAAQLTAHIPLLVMLFLSRKQLLDIRTYRKEASTANTILWYLLIAPLLMLVVLSLVFGLGLRDMWGIPMWALSGLLGASFIRSQHLKRALDKIKRYLTVWLTLVTVLMVVYVGFGDKIRHKPSRMQWPEQALAAQAYDTWQSISTCPLDSVSGNRWLSGLIAMNHDFPSQMIAGSSSHSPWMTKSRIEHQGTLVVWQGDSNKNLPLLDEIRVVDDVNTIMPVPRLNTDDPKANRVLIKKEGEWQIAWRDSKAKEPLTVNWTAYIPQQCLK